MPKQKPYEFKSESEIIATLQSKRPVLDSWFNKKISDLSQIVNESVGGNTFRAFQHLPDQPSKVFRNWAKNEFRKPDDIMGVLQNESQKSYDEWLNGLVNKLSHHWEFIMSKSISYGAARKLTNLLMKRILLWEVIPEKERTILKQFAHVPFDQYALVSIRRCVNFVSIPTNPTMSFVNSEGLYINLQKFIRRVVAELNLPPIYFDLLVWNIAHNRITN